MGVDFPGLHCGSSKDLRWVWMDLCYCGPVLEILHLLIGAQGLYGRADGQGFSEGVVKYWGLPGAIISDRDARFTGKFWTELFRLLGSQLHFSTSFHPQTDGQTEQMNCLLEEYLRHFVSANHKDWARLLDVAQFSFNVKKSESTGKSPFEIVLGRPPLTPGTVAPGYRGPNPLAYKFAKD